MLPKTDTQSGKEREREMKEWEWTYAHTLSQHSRSSSVVVMIVVVLQNCRPQFCSFLALSHPSRHHYSPSLCNRCELLFFAEARGCIIRLNRWERESILSAPLVSDCFSLSPPERPTHTWYRRLEASVDSGRQSLNVFFRTRQTRNAARSGDNG